MVPGKDLSEFEHQLPSIKPIRNLTATGADRATESVLCEITGKLALPQLFAFDSALAGLALFPGVSRKCWQNTDALVEDLESKLATGRQGGGTKAAAKMKGKGKLSPIERHGRPHAVFSVREI